MLGVCMSSRKWRSNVLFTQISRAESSFIFREDRRRHGTREKFTCTLLYNSVLIHVSRGAKHTHRKPVQSREERHKLERVPRQN